MRINSAKYLVDITRQMVGDPTITALTAASERQGHKCFELPHMSDLGGLYDAHYPRIEAALGHNVNNQTLGGVIGFGLDKSGEMPPWLNDDVLIQRASFIDLADKDDVRLAGRALLVTMATRVLICAAYDLAHQKWYRECNARTLE